MKKRSAADCYCGDVVVHFEAGVFTTSRILLLKMPDMIANKLKPPLAIKLDKELLFCAGRMPKNIVDMSDITNMLFL